MNVPGSMRTSLMPMEFVTGPAAWSSASGASRRAAKAGRSETACHADFKIMQATVMLVLQFIGFLKVG